LAGDSWDEKRLGYLAQWKILGTTQEQYLASRLQLIFSKAEYLAPAKRPKHLKG